MAATLKELREQFATTMTQAEQIRQQYEGKSESMTADEEERYDKFLNEADGIRRQIERSEKETALKSWAAEIPDKLQHGAARQLDLDPDNPAKQADFLKAAAYKPYLRGIGETDDPQRYYRNTKEFRRWAEFVASKSAELKAYQSDNPAGGGMLVTPQILANEIITLMKDIVWMRQVATLMQVATAESLGVPAIDTDPSDSDWTNELGTGNEETTMAFGKREFRPNPLAKLVKLSKKLLRQVVDADTIVLDRLTYKAGIAQEKAFLLGTGASQPLGVFVADNNGIPTSRDTAAASSTVLAGDDVIGVFYALKAQYRQKAQWILNRTVVSAVRKLKDSSNNYLWQPGLGGIVAGQGSALIGSQPDLLMGRPVMESEYAPGTLTSGLYTMIVGDFSKYWIVDALDMQIQVLYELYATSNQMGYILRCETDGMPVLAEGFARLKMA